LVGAVVGVVAVLYLVANHPLGLIWRSLPAKELAIGILFCAGTMVALQPRLPLTPAFIFAVISFAALCSLNCISIAVWECELDRAQRKVSIATWHPNIARAVGKLCLVLALTALGLAIVFREASLVFGCISVSALLLRWLGASRDFKEGRFEIAPAVSNRRSLGRDERTALADLVLLTPIAVLLIGAL
jgi:hypothetical protein